MSTGQRASKRVTSIGKSAIHEMTRLSKEVEDVAFLSWAKPTTDTPEHIREAAVRAIRDGLAGGYSENAGIPELRRAVIEKLGSFNGIRADISQVLVTVGAIEGLFAALLAVIDPGDEVILPSPTYSTHIDQVAIASGIPVTVPSVEEEGFALDVEGIRRAITKRTRAILYCSPCNPTGTVYSREQLRQLAEVALDHGLTVITDEAYEYFTYDGNEHFSIASIPEMRKNAISCYTFTKTYAMTGWRVGYLHADEAMIPQINKAHVPCAICAPVVSQHAALAALTGPQECVAVFREHYLVARDLMCDRLDRLSSALGYQRPGGSYLMFPRILLEEGRDSSAFCRKLLREAGVSATPGSAFGPTGEGHMRLSFCVPLEEIDRAFDRMDRFFDSSM